MTLDLITALPALVVAGVIPGFFWTRTLIPTSDQARQLAFSIGLSMVLVPSVSLLQIRIFDTGVTLMVASVSAAVVFFGGLGAYLIFGPAKDSEEPFSSPPAPLGLPVLAPLIASLGLALAASFGYVSGELVMLPAALLAALAGLAHLITPRPEAPSEEQRGWMAGSAVKYAALAVVLGLALLRSYLGPVLNDWPHMRGDDQYQHTIMTRLMLSEGSIGEFMLYPPGIHLFLAEVSRFSGLDPLKLFPILAPILMAMPALALYALASRLWGWECGVAAALFAGLLLGGTYWYFEHGRYPNLIAAQFLLALAMSALADLLESPNVRSGLTLALLGSSVVLYHQVGSLYEAALFGVVGLVFLPYLLLRHRRRALGLMASFALLGVLSVAYAWTTYDLPQTVAGLFGGSVSGAGGEAVAMAIGTKPPFALEHLILSTSHPVLWLGIAGAVFLIGDRGGSDKISYLMMRFALIFWVLMMFVGSRTAMSAFPDRFERDLGVPLSVLAAFALVSLLASLRPRRPAVFAASLAAVLAVTLVGLRAAENFEKGFGPSPQLTLTRPVLEAGAWLEENNEGGNIIATPYLDGLPSRGMLALGGYSGMQSFTLERIVRARDLPPTGAGPLRDSLWVLTHPDGERTEEIIEDDDVRYLVFHKSYPGVYWWFFAIREDGYQTVFENETVIIFEPV
ncbi:MAG: hypothetical protein ACRDSJ_16195 [Rubrobacteraceae bacterium]